MALQKLLILFELSVSNFNLTDFEFNKILINKNQVQFYFVTLYKTLLSISGNTSKPFFKSKNA